MLSEFYRRSAELYQLQSIQALLGWDMQTQLPPSGSEARAAQQRVLAELKHLKRTDPEYTDLVDTLAERSSELEEEDQVNIREVKRALDRARKLPAEFVAERAALESSSFAVWIKARPANNFAETIPFLEKLVDMRRREADLVGFKEHPYDALLDLYEPYALLRDIKPLLLALAAELEPLLEDLSGRQEPALPPACGYPLEQQMKFCRAIAQDLGFSFDSGRLDTSAHPFQYTIGIGDVRMTTRFEEKDFLVSVYPTLHETGHALYELGLPLRWRGTPLGTAVSLGIHESQSRLWENMIGRSRHFSVYLHNRLKTFFPEAHSSLTPDRIWKSANQVAPTLIRVEADEVSYSLHIVIRMLLEESLIAGTLKVRDLPGAWSDLYHSYLGIRPQSDTDGVMQDVHWFTGAIGYFPTYALGNLYAAELLRTARLELSDLDAQVAAGNFSALRKWLGKHVHSQGMRYPSRELVHKVCGKEPGTEAFVTYLKDKLSV